MKKSLEFRFKWFWFNVGWYPGDPFKVFGFNIGETQQAYPSGKVDFVTLLSVQFAYLSLCFGWFANDQSM